MSNGLAEIAEDSARGSFYLISGTAVSTVIMAVEAIFIGRILGPELYGQYTLAFVVPQLFFLLADFGVNQGIIKFSASLRNRGKLDHLAEMVKHAMILKAASGIAFFVISYISADVFASAFLQRPDLIFYARLASFSILFQTLSTTAISAFVGIDKTEYNALTSNVQAITKTLVSITLILIGLGVVGAIIGSVFSYTVAAIVGTSMLLLILRKTKVSKNDKGDNLKDNIKILMRYGAPIYIFLLLTGLIPTYQNIILAIFTTDAEIGNFKAAANFVTLITVITIPITTALIPAFSKLDGEATQKVKVLFRLVNKYTAILLLPITVLIMVFSGEIVQIVYGSTFKSAPLFLTTYCLLYFLVGLGYLTFTSFYNGLGETKTIMKIGLITFIAVVPLSPILTKVLGVVGLIIAFIISSLMGTLYALHKARVNFKIRLETITLAKIYLISLASSLPALLLLQFSITSKILNVIVGGSLYFFVYATLIPMTRIIDLPELDKIGQTVQRIQPLSLVIRPFLDYQRRVLHRKN